MPRDTVRRVRERAGGSLHVIMLGLVLVFLVISLGTLSIWGMSTYPTVEEAIQLADSQGEKRRALTLLTTLRSEWKETMLTLAGVTATPCFALLAGIFGYRTGKKQGRD